MARDAPKVSGVDVAAYTVPTDAPEADGTIEWDSTTVVLVEIEAGGTTGLGYTYAHRAAAGVVADLLAPIVRGQDAFAIARLFDAMQRAVRNAGRPGIAACAISAVDTALWDLKARLLDMPLAALFGPRRNAVPIYGSGGFTSYSHRQTIEQFAGWTRDLGCTLMKMKIGAEPHRDLDRVQAVRDALPNIALMVDANGALTPQQALAFAEAAAEHVIWFEEPVSSDDRAGLRRLRERLPAGIDLAAGEYAYDVHDVRDLVDAVDVMQLDATRCCGFTGFLAAAAVADAHHLPLSAHTAPALHLPICLAAPRLRHIEWFHDHARIEAMLFEGAPEPRDGAIAADLTRPGHGLTFRRADAARFAA